MNARQMALNALKLIDKTLQFTDWENGDGEEIGEQLRSTVAALEADIAQPEPTNDELENLWEEHGGHPADFAADVLERWGGWTPGVLGYGGSLNAIVQAVEPVAFMSTNLSDSAFDRFRYLQSDMYPTPIYTTPPEPAVNAELLKALQDAVDRQAYREGTGPAWWENARAAIAKAAS